MYDKVASALGGAAAPTPYTPFDETRSALDRAQELSSRVYTLADRLVGPRVTPANSTKPKDPPTNSLFQSMSYHADQTKDMISGAMEALEAIERDLP